MKIENLIEKDKQKQVNPFAFTRLEARLKEKTKIKKSVLEYSLQLIGLLLVFAFSMNIFSQISPSQETILKEASFEQFAQENYFDILLNYYPTILFE